MRRVGIVMSRRDGETQKETCKSPLGDSTDSICLQPKWLQLRCQFSAVTSQHHQSIMIHWTPNPFPVLGFFHHKRPLYLLLSCFQHLVFLSTSLVWHQHSYSLISSRELLPNLTNNRWIYHYTSKSWFMILIIATHLHLLTYSLHLIGPFWCQPN